MVQFLRITCQTGPSGRVTWGRAGRRPICAHAGTANATVSANDAVRRWGRLCAASITLVPTYHASAVASSSVARNCSSEDALLWGRPLACAVPSAPPVVPGGGLSERPLRPRACPTCVLLASGGAALFGRFRRSATAPCSSQCSSARCHTDAGCSTACSMSAADYRGTRCGDCL